MFLFFSFPLLVFGQNDSIWKQKPSLKIEGFMDIFYAYDFNKPTTNYRQVFLFNHNRHNEFNLNLGYVKLAVNNPKYRANLALQAGTYVVDNYATEPTGIKNIFEANIGIALNSKNNLWIDAGIFPSHIGFESAASIENWTLTRSILAESSPYYLSGAKITYNPNKYWEASASILNGWQHIQKIQGNSLPSYGTQIKHKPNDNITLNYSTFIGTDKPDISRQMRYFNNLYGQYQITKKWGLITGFDIGFEQKSKGDSKFNNWYSPVIITQYCINNHWKTAFRAEYYQDKYNVIIPKTNQNGFKTAGFSINIDYAPTSNIACRLEGRWFHSPFKTFDYQNYSKKDNLFIVGSIAIKLMNELK